MKAGKDSRKLGKKGLKTREQILLAASACLARLGDRDTTFQAIADEAGVSQPLVVKYFISRDKVFPAVVEYWLRIARNKTEEALLKSGSPEERLCQYLYTSLEIYQSHSVIPKIYLLLHYFAAFNETYRYVNTEIKRVAVDRLSEIIRQGQIAGTFRPGDSKLLARTIHNGLIGLLLSSITENSLPPETDLLANLQDFALAMLKSTEPN